MDIDRSNFKLRLLNILQDIAGARFVSIDLEMSGINTGFSHSGSGKQTLQEVYAEVRKGAKSYQILQWGLTCVEEDLENGIYHAKPYNMYVSPVISGISKRDYQDRQFRFSSEACNFLLKSGFDFGRVFARGVPYLSRQEEAIVRLNFQKREEKNSTKEDLILKTEIDIEFYEDTKHDIQRWVDDPAPEYDFYNIGHPGGRLNAYQRRLVYQLIRKEFPNLEAFSGAGGAFMQIRKLDRNSKSERLKVEKERLEEHIANQKGLRFIFEAMSGGDLDGIDPKWFCDKSSKTYEEDLKQANLTIKRIRQALKRKKHIIVGHNVFTDLLFLHNSFVGHLPLTVTDFKKQMNLLFPIVIDTRFMAIYNMDTMTPGANLRELLETFPENAMPVVLLADRHASYYSRAGKEHEAGYDAWMTAELFLKVALKLYAHRVQNGEDPDSSDDFTADNIRRSGQDNLFNNPRGDPPIANIGSKSEEVSWPEESSAHIKSSFSDGDFYGNQGICRMIPYACSPFWKLYINRLRVTPSAEGLLILDDQNM